MSRQTRLAERNTASTHRKPTIIVVIVLCVSLALILKSSDFSIIAMSILSRVVQYFEANAHVDAALFLRYQEELIQNLSTQMQAKEWMSYEISPRSLPFGFRIKCVLVAAAVDISVIIPTLNEEKYLQACLNSLTRQSYGGNYEIIVVDGGSRDGTLEVAKRSADYVLPADKRPVGAARNEGARIANGEVAAFIDADTIASEQWLSAIERVFKDQAVIGVTGPTLPYHGKVLDSMTYSFWTIYFQRILLSVGMPHVIGFNCAYRKDLFLRVGGFDETSVMSEDIRLALKMRQFGKIAFEKQMSALTSTRRFQKYGRAYIASLYVLNGFSTLLLNRSSRNYPPVR